MRVCLEHASRNVSYYREMRGSVTIGESVTAYLDHTRHFCLYVMAVTSVRTFQ